MNIEELSSKVNNKFVTVSFSYDEIRDISNSLYYAASGRTIPDENRPQTIQIYGKCKILFDMIKHGFVQPETMRYFILEQSDTSVQAPNQTLEHFLTEEEIDIFNAYLSKGDIREAFENSDFCQIYNKIVGNRVSDDIQELIYNQ